jgi:hypothetical protein
MRNLAQRTCCKDRVAEPLLRRQWGLRKQLNHKRISNHCIGNESNKPGCRSTAGPIHDPLDLLQIGSMRGCNPESETKYQPCAAGQACKSFTN